MNLRYWLLADGVQNPGNLGTLLRSAHCFGWDAICLFNDCVDPFNDKLRCIRFYGGADKLSHTPT